ncbi:MAG TPA: hypothetical protein VI316_07465 [Candidatus Dormibacteraeota bacterium]
MRPGESRVERATRSAVEATGRALAPLGRRLAPLRRIPVELRVAMVIMAIFLGGFFAAVVPLLTTGGRDPHAEISGRYPSSMPVGQDYILPVALDNTSGAVISPVCVILHSDPAGAVGATQAQFQGLETVPFAGGRACGGSLSGQEVISVRVTLRPSMVGSARVSLIAGQGAREIGPALTGTVEIVSG